MTDEERFDMLRGQMSALTCAVRALIDHHPYRDRVLQHFDAHLEETGSLALPVAVQESFWQGLNEVRAFLIADPRDTTREEPPELPSV